MTGQRHTLNGTAIAQPWVPRRGDLAWDTGANRIGVVVSLPEDTGVCLYQLRPEGGGDEWASPRVRLRRHPDAAVDGLSLAETVMPLDDAPPGDAPRSPAWVRVGVHALDTATGRGGVVQLLQGGDGEVRTGTMQSATRAHLRPVEPSDHRGWWADVSKLRRSTT